MTGEVTVNLYYGTKFDIINVPYETGLIARTATKTKTLTGQVVWETTWLTSINLNMDDYNDIIGAQFANVIDTEHGAHWYEVVGYTQLSKKCTNIGLSFDPILTIGINRITGISGVLNRWTVNNDAVFKYTFADEPINQLADYQYSYYTYNAGTGPYTPLAGFPTDMTQTPTIIQYPNTPEDATIYVPNLSRVASPTQFITNMPGITVSNDGLGYYVWSPANKAGETYQQAMSLGYDLASNSYQIPTSALITVALGADGIRAGTITGGATTQTTGFSLYSGGEYENQKAREIGRFFTLCNPYSGDSVTVANYDLNSTNISVYADPSPTGRFYAKFSGYLDSGNTLIGLVQTPGYSPITLSVAGQRQDAALNEIMNKQTLTWNLRNQLTQNQADLLTGQLGIEGFRKEQLIDIFGDFLPKAAQHAISENWVNLVEDLWNLGQQGLKLGVQLDTQEQQLKTQYNANRNNLITQYRNQMRMLSAQGTIGKNQPLQVKYAGSMAKSTSTYGFIVQQTDLKASDRSRADKFFRAYGYNVNYELLNSPSQLRCRQRFTFVQAEDVEIESLYGNTALTRTRDFNTVNYIKERFAAGIRIWTEEPNYNWAIWNPIKTNWGETSEEVEA